MDGDTIERNDAKLGTGMHGKRSPSRLAKLRSECLDTPLQRPYNRYSGAGFQSGTRRGVKPGWQAGSGFVRPVGPEWPHGLVVIRGERKTEGT